MLTLVNSKKPLSRKPLKEDIKKNSTQKERLKKKDDSAYLSSYYFKDIFRN